MPWEPFSHTVIVNSNKIPNDMVNSFPSGETKACHHNRGPILSTLKNSKIAWSVSKAMESNKNFPTLSISQPLATVALEHTASACHHCSACPVLGVIPSLASQAPSAPQWYKNHCIPVCQPEEGWGTWGDTCLLDKKTKPKQLSMNHYIVKSALKIFAIEPYLS